MSEPDPSTADQEELSAFDLPSVEAELIEVKDIPLDDIAELENIRQGYDGIEGLAETMHLNGQLQACWVRPSVNSEQPYELIFGYRRKRAAELLREKGVDGWETLRCEVRKVADNEQMAQVIVENFQRENPSAAAEARAMKALKDTLGLSNVEVAKRLGCDPSQVSHRLSLLKLAPPPQPVQLEAPDQDESEDSPEEPASSAVPTDTEAAEPAPKEEAPAEENDPTDRYTPQVDILQLVDDGKLSASVAEVIVGVDKREDQEKLAKLAVKNNWNVKKATNWAKSVKENVADEGSEEMGPIEWVQIEDVTELPRLKVKDDLSVDELNQIILYSQLRNYMDREIIDYLDVELGIPYESIWDYVTGLPAAEVGNLIERMARRYLGAAHRFSTLEPEIRDTLGQVEIVPARDPDLSLPAADLDEDLLGLDDDLFGLPEAS
jgi:ParB/RepB/Spo0J family partition protein